MQTQTESFAWAAGFLDGEGSFHIVIERHRPKPYHVPRIAATGVVRDPLDRLADLFGGHVCTKSRGGGRENWKPVYAWTLTGLTLLIPALESVRPFLLVRSGQADVLLDYCQGPGAGRRGLRLTDETRAERDRYWLLLRKLNERGVVREWEHP